MSTLQLIRKNKGLIKVFKRYQERYLNVGKKPDITKFIPEIIYRTMRLEGEKISRKQAQALFNNRVR
jgi:hypothetical protein